MKGLIIFLTDPFTIITLLFFCGLFASRPKIKLRIFYYSLLFFVVISTPFISYILGYPLINTVSTIKNDNNKNIKSVIVLTAGIKKNSLGDWTPSNNSANRALLGLSHSQKLSVPVVISGGLTSSKVLSEAVVVRDYLKIENSILDQGSINTHESAKNLASYCDEREGPLLIISGKYHRLRTFLTFKSYNCDVVFLNEKDDINIKMFFPSHKGMSLFKNLIYEYVGLIYYLVSNKIKILVLFDI